MHALQRVSPPWKMLSIQRSFARTFSCYAKLRINANTTASAYGKTTTRTGQVVDRTTIEALLRRRMYYTPSFEIYGGSSGFYDLGPLGSALQANLVNAWRDQFIVQEDALEVNCPAVTPEDVLRTSGHTDKFTDWMCKDVQTGEVFRVDHLIKEALQARLQQSQDAQGQQRRGHGQEDEAKSEEFLVAEYSEVLAKLNDMDGPSMWQLVKKYEIKSPTTGEELSTPTPFNLMFQTSIGPSGGIRGYLRPETAQGQFLNFAKLLEFNQKKMPFTSASIGTAFRNEISPRAGLLRAREFLLAELEHFVDPSGSKQHSRFDEIKNVSLELLDRESQLSGRIAIQSMTTEAAVSRGLVHNETLGYFLARIQQFLVRVGIEPAKIRFRQHLPNEMAHYAIDCWDAEVLCTHGWIECVGCADRAAFDLSRHAARTGTSLNVTETRKQPIEIEEWEVDIDMKRFGPKFRKDAPAIEGALQSLTQQQREEMSKELVSKGKTTLCVPSLANGAVEIDTKLVNVERRARVEHIREYTPNVIEPSFGMGRILYCLLEHAYWTREETEARAVMSFPAPIAPIKAVLLPLSNHPDFAILLRTLQRNLRQLNVSNRIDDSGASIGRRYTRNDELGTPFGITVDFQSLKDNTLTLRDRDSTHQVRADERSICDAVKSLTDGTKTWAEISRELPRFLSQELD